MSCGVWRCTTECGEAWNIAEARGSVARDQPIRDAATVLCGVVRAARRFARRFPLLAPVARVTGVLVLVVRRRWRLRRRWRRAARRRDITLAWRELVHELRDRERFSL